MALSTPQLTPRGQTIVWRVVMFLAIVVLVIILIGAPFVLTAADHAANNSDRVAQGNQLNSCASSFHAILVDKPNTALEIAQGNVDKANAEVSKIVAEGLQASIDSNPGALAAANAALQPAVAAVDTANADETTKATAVSAMADTYQVLSTLRRTDPANFLERCAQLPSS